MDSWALLREMSLGTKAKNAFVRRDPQLTVVPQDCACEPMDSWALLREITQKIGRLARTILRDNSEINQKLTRIFKNDYLNSSTKNSPEHIKVTI